MDVARASQNPDLSPTESISVLAQVLLALRSTADLVTACSVAGTSAMRLLDAAEYRLLSVDGRSGALRALDETGLETPYLAEIGGVVEHVMRFETPVFDDGAGTAGRETALWLPQPASLIAAPLMAAGSVHGILLVGFTAPRPFSSLDRLAVLSIADALALTFEREEIRRVLRDERQRITQLEQRVSEGEEASSSLMSTVAHEIRTPLTAIKAYTEAILENLANPHAPRERFLTIINDECDRLSRLVGDVLDLSRVEAGQRPLRLAKLSLSTLVQETLEGIQPVAASRRVTFQSDLDPDLTPEADPDLLKRLLINLISNAVKFSPPSGVVRLLARARGEEWMCTVQDEGPGIPPEDVPRIFERFFHARQAGHHEAEGTGLGLAISRGIVELHGGRIWTQSVEPHGTRFCFSLPLRQLATSRARRVARLVWNRTDLRSLFDHTVEMVAASMEAEIVSLMLVDPDLGDLFIASSRGLDSQSLSGRRTPMRSGVAGSVAAWGQALLVNNIETDRRFRRLNHPQYRTKSLLCAPMRVQGEVIGVFNVNNKTDGSPFDADDLSVVRALIERVAGAVERAVAHPDSPHLVLASIEAVRTVTQMKRQSLLGGHDTVRLTRLLAREAGMTDSETDLLGYVASIHDLGMSQVEGHRESGPLTAHAKSELERHPEVTLEILRPLEYVAQVRDIILAHHENWDGSGYPRGLTGEAIPLGSRILAVVDAYESMTRGRPYRPPRTVPEALQELRGEAGRQFDPRVVEAFVNVIEHDVPTT